MGWKRAPNIPNLEKHIQRPCVFEEICWESFVCVCVCVCVCFFLFFSRMHAASFAITLAQNCWKSIRGLNASDWKRRAGAEYVNGCKRLVTTESQRFWAYILQSYCVFIHDCKLHYVNYPGADAPLEPSLSFKPWWHPVSLRHSWIETLAEDRDNFGVCERALRSSPIQDDRAALLQVRLDHGNDLTSWYFMIRCGLLEHVEAQPYIFRCIASSLSIISYRFEHVMIGIEVTGLSNCMGEIAQVHWWRRDQLITSYDFTMPFAWKLSPVGESMGNRHQMAMGWWEKLRWCPTAGTPGRWSIRDLARCKRSPSYGRVADFFFKKWSYCNMMQFITNTLNGFMTLLVADDRWVQCILSQTFRLFAEEAASVRGMEGGIEARSWSNIPKHGRGNAHDQRFISFLIHRIIRNKTAAARSLQRIQQQLK